ncbi:hypothetical protein Tco_1366369 [Tanacetum coccineum]
MMKLSKIRDNEMIMISKMRDKINSKKKRLNLEEAKRARTEKSFGPDFVSFMIENEPTSYQEAAINGSSRKKMKPDGTIDKYKARLAIKGFRQQAGLYYFDTYSVRITPVKMILAIAALKMGKFIKWM